MDEISGLHFLFLLLIIENKIIYVDKLYYTPYNIVKKIILHFEYKVKEWNYGI